MSKSLAHPKSNSLHDLPTIDLLYYLRLILRRKWFIIFFCFFITAGVAYGLLQVQPTYKATSAIVIDKKSATANQALDSLPINGNQKEYLATELEILKSTELSSRVVARMALDTHPVFDPRQQTPGFNPITTLRDIIAQWRSHPLPEASEEKSEAVIQQEIFDKVVQQFMSGLSISTVRNTQVVKIHYETIDPELAASIANTMADVYIESHLEAKLVATTKTTSWLNDKLSKLRDNLKQSEGALQNYRDEEGLIDVKGIKTIDSQELTALTQQYVVAKGSRYNAEIQYNQVKALGAKPSLNSLMSLPTVLEQPVVQNMNAKKAQADQKVAELNRLFGPKHPSMVAAVSEAQSAEEALNNQVRIVVDSIETNYQQTLKNEQSLKQQIDRTKTRFQSINRKEFRLEELEREVETNKQIYNLFLTRAKESSEAGQLRVPNARVIDPAKSSKHPVKPKIKLILAVIFAISLFTAIAWVFIRDFIDKTFHTIYDVEEHLQLSVLGKIPLIKKLSKTKGGRPFKGFMSLKDQSFTEAIRSLRTSFIVSSLDSPYRTTLVTSSVPNEGKSTISINLAEALGLMEKTLLIDVDLRRAELTKALDVDPSQPGLTDILTGKIQRAEGIVSVSKHLDFMPAGTSLYYALENISSNKMKELLTILGTQYDRILLDTPPVHAVSDAIALSKIVDSVIFVVRAESTKMNVAKRATQNLMNVDANIAGVILNSVDRDKEKYYGGYDSGYGYGYEQAGDPDTSMDTK